MVPLSEFHANCDKNDQIQLKEKNNEDDPIPADSLVPAFTLSPGWQQGSYTILTDWAS